MAGFLNSSTIKTTIEPIVEGLAIRPDLLMTTITKNIYYDIKVVAISADSSHIDPYKALDLADQDKRRKYSSMGPSFRPLIFSAGGLLSKETSIEYKKLQGLIGASAPYLDQAIALILLRARARSRNSLANS
jgi:hypothetical protein